jgi:para-nitrobenzyl esterase
VPAPAATAIAAEYPLSAYPSPAVALGAVGTDAIFACPALGVDQSLAKYVPVYAYEFSDENAPERYLPPTGFPYGAAHESEVPYLFRLRNAPIPGHLSPPQRRLAGAMRHYWTSFAARGRPSAPDGPQWPRFGQDGPRMLSLVTPRPQTGTGFAADHKCAFWAVAG